MSRSIHVTRKDLQKERRFSARDTDIPVCNSGTELEKKHIQKLLHKDNEQWRRQATEYETPGVGQLAFEGDKIVRTLFKKRAAKPDVASDTLKSNHGENKNG